MKTLPILIIMVLFTGEALSQKHDTTKIADYNEQVFIRIDEPAEYARGKGELYNFIKNNLKYPEENRGQGIEGTVFVRYTIKKDGSIADIEIMKGLSPAINKEAIRIIKLMPNWIPARTNGEAVDSKFVMPLVFREEIN